MGKCGINIVDQSTCFLSGGPAPCMFDGGSVITPQIAQSAAKTTAAKITTPAIAPGIVAAPTGTITQAQFTELKERVLARLDAIDPTKA